MPCKRDIDAVEALKTKPSGAVAAITNWSFGTFGALQQLYKNISPEMPEDLNKTEVPSPLPDDDATVDKFNYDEGHAGRYSVPGTDGGSLDFQHVSGKEQPNQYILQNLCFRPVGSPDPSDGEEVVIFSPGLNTLHEPMADETTTPQRLQYYVNVIGTSMAQLHTGTSFDQGDAVIEARHAPIFRGIMWILGIVLPEGVKPSVSEEGDIIFQARSLDSIQVVLSQMNVIDTPLKVSYRALFDTTKDPAGKPFVLAVYSRASMEIEAALSKHIADHRKAGENRNDIEARLRQRVTILTCGSTASNYPDGPAYLHMAAWTDPLNESLGVNGRKTNGAGKDAVFLNFNSPFAEGASDNHNMGSVQSQFLSLVMSASKAAGIRDLWERAQRDEMVIPDNCDRLVNCMMRITKAIDWLWNEEEAMEGVADDVIPDEDVAEQELTDAMGDDFVARIKASIA